ncbi:MAG TPA: hypothetical protein VFE24_11075 [Pirellulales bacterium]|jgi:hypothetical protein|nr:hypothetical protein [Pirellulales bacterium]
MLPLVACSAKALFLASAPSTFTLGAIGGGCLLVFQALRTKQAAWAKCSLESDKVGALAERTAPHAAVRPLRQAA